MSGSLTIIDDRLRTWPSQVKKWILKLNLFRSHPLDPAPTEHQGQTQLISTRIFLLLLVTILFIITISISQIKVTINVTEENPTYDQYLKFSSTYSATLSCPCTMISIPYNKFISINASYHQVCDSIYTTSSWWNAIYSMSNSNKTSTNFRYTGGKLFQALSIFCNLTRSTINDALIDFNSIQFISGTPISRDSFDMQIDAIIGLFISSTIQEFVRSRAFLRDEFQLNHVMAGVFTNVWFERQPYLILPDNISVTFVVVKSVIYDNDQSKCSCEDSPFCTEPLYIDDNRLYSVPGMFTGCYLIEALLQSNIACFYNQSCINDLIQKLNPTVIINTTAIDATIKSRYELNSNIGSIVDQLMVEQWINTTSHEAYYTQCYPVKCTYTYVGKRAWLNTFTIMITPVNGLIIILKIIVPLIVTIFRSSPCSRTNRTLRQRISTLWTKSKMKLRTINLFRSSSLSMINIQYRVETGIISTYVFFTVITILLAVLVGYISQATIQKSIIIYSPSYHKYVEFYKNYGENISCPCTTINMRQDEIINIEVRFHQVCGSVFVSNAYFSFLNQSNFLQTVNINGFTEGVLSFDNVIKGQNHLQLIGLWCQLANWTFADKLVTFYATQFIARSVLSENLFNQQVQALIDYFVTSTTSMFVRSLLDTRQIIKNNALMSGHRSNAFLYLVPPDYETYFTWTWDLTVGYNSYPDVTTCICIFADTCTEPLFYESHINYTETKVRTVPGLLIGCYIDDATLGSTLECYYNQSCLNTIHSEFQLPPSFNASALDPSSPSQFNTNSSIGDLVAQMMVENWANTSSHIVFYNKCQPSLCIYSYEDKNDLLIVITTVMGLLGGLTLVLKTIIFLIVMFLHQYRQYVVQRQTSSNDPSNVHNTKFCSNHMNKLKQAIVNINLFRTSLHEVEIDAHEVRIQIISTRIYLTLLIATFTVVAVSIWQIPVVKITVVNYPSYVKYSIMHRQYQQSLSCPCTTISIPYDKFMNVEPVRFHQVCQSIYVTSNWSELIDMSYYGNFGFQGDFRIIGSPMFRMLGLLCNQIRTTIADAIITFNANYFVTSHVMPVDRLEQQTQSNMNFLISSIKSSFKSSLQLGRDMTQGNALFSAIVGNAQLNFTADNVSDLSINVEYTNIAGNSSSCSCLQNTSCALPARILTTQRDGPIPIVRFTVPGVVFACYLVDSILQSNLICFYNQSCIDELIAIMASPVVLNTVALNTTIPSQYKPDSAIGDIVDQLMVEQWIEESSHETYYAQCNPTTCSASYENNNNFIVVFSITMGVIGTLSILLKVIVPRAVRKLWLCCKNNNRVNSEAQNPSSAGNRPFGGTFLD